jgi:TonB family protein
VDEPAGPAIEGMRVGYSGPEVGVPFSIGDPAFSTAPIVSPPIARAMARPATVEPVAVIRRYKEGGNVKLGAVLHRAEPPYPPLARATHVFGNVELECVVGIDGHIREVKVKGGNPLLVRAAVEAAWQWVYAPTKLNDVPIEIVTILTFSFKLN